MVRFKTWALTLLQKGFYTFAPDGLMAETALCRYMLFTEEGDIEDIQDFVDAKLEVDQARVKYGTDNILQVFASNHSPLALCFADFVRFYVDVGQRQPAQMWHDLRALHGQDPWSHSEFFATNAKRPPPLLIPSSPDRQPEWVHMQAVLSNMNQLCLTKSREPELRADAPAFVPFNRCQN